MVIPGEGVAATSPVAGPDAGSIQEAALEHPMVQRAKEIFNAEVRSVVDLRTSSAINRRSAMINPLKMAEMLSQANKMQEEMQRKLEQTVVGARAAAAR